MIKENDLESMLFTTAEVEYEYHDLGYHESVNSKIKFNKFKIFYDECW